MGGRERAREERDVRGKGHGDGGVGVLEDDALAGQGVDVRRRRTREAVGAEMVGPQGIDADQEDVADRGPRPPAGDEKRGSEQGEDRRGGRSAAGSGSEEGHGPDPSRRLVPGRRDRDGPDAASLGGPRARSFKRYDGPGATLGRGGDLFGEVRRWRQPTPEPTRSSSRCWRPRRVRPRSRSPTTSTDGSWEAGSSRRWSTGRPTSPRAA